MSSLHRPQHSLSQLTSSQMPSADAGPAGQAGASSDANALASRPPGFRHSLDLKNHSVNVDLGYYAKENPAEVAAPLMSPPASQVLSTPPKLQTSFSANDIPTVKNPNSGNNAGPNANAHAQQHFHNHNASIGRIPLGAVPNRHSRELSSDGHMGVTQSATFPSIGSTLHGNAPSFGPPASQGQMQQQQQQQQSTPPSGPISSPGSGSSTGQYPSYYPPAYNQASPNGSGYNVNMLAMGMAGMNINGYPSQNYTGYAPMYQSTQNRGDSQQRVINQRRAQDNEGKTFATPPVSPELTCAAMARFQNLTLQDIGGQIYSLCKDQHGCRFLQKQLETRSPQSIHMIWLETKAYVVELMTDPFGNYLCQKLLEYCTDDERTTLIENAAPHMVRIALNQHGTRALQKMIEFVSIPQHVQIIVDALRYQVVDLIQDLNGNHVIQKCLNKLSAEDAQFIFDAVGNHCIEVGTHRHGCCVLQRCIDHASGDQKVWLVGRITSDALRLVQDPFGNYVVQYIIDLNEPAFTEPVVKVFGGRIPQLSRHKFSSNVIEKCLRCASDSSRDMMISEMVVPGEMERLIRDSFGNYVVQTALEHATFHMKQQLVETIRPILPAIRTTPHGRRIQSKVQAFDQRSGSNSGQATPADATGGQISIRQGRGGLGNPNALMNPGGYHSSGINNPRGQMSYPTTGNLAVPPPQPPRLNPGFTYPGASMPPGPGEGQFF